MTRDRGFTLQHVLELSFKEDCPTLLVITEQAFSGWPQGVGSLLRLHDNVKDLLGDRSVQLSEDGKVLLCPFDVVGVEKESHRRGA